MATFMMNIACPFDSDLQVPHATQIWTQGMRPNMHTAQAKYALIFLAPSSGVFLAPRAPGYTIHHSNDKITDKWALSTTFL